MIKSDAVRNIIKKIGLLQREALPICKMSNATLTTGRKYKYADLEAVWDSIKGLMARHELTVTCTVDGDVMETVVWFDAEYIGSRGKIVCARPNDPQAWGSAMTYARRYYLLAILGLIVTGEDNDAATAMPQVEKARGWLTKEEKAKISAYTSSKDEEFVPVEETKK